MNTITSDIIVGFPGETEEDFNELMQGKSIVGLAMESDTAFVENNGEIYYIKSNADSKAYYIKKENGTLKKEEIAIRLVSD